VKRSGRDEPIWVVIHMFMEAMPGISVYSYLYLKLAKMLCLSYYLRCFQQNWRTRTEQVVSRRTGKIGKEGKVTQIRYTHVSKCKNDKIKKVTCINIEKYKGET
jgi:hypothetical protein